MKRTRWRPWPSAGGYPFPCAPDLDPADVPALWAPGLSASVVVLAAAPADAADAEPIEPERIGRILADAMLPSGRHLVVADDGGRHRLWLRDPAPGTPLAFVLINDDRYLVRVAVAGRLQQRLQTGAAPALPAKCTPSPYQRHRLTRLLALLDADQAGATRQDMAVLFEKEWQPLPSLDWQNSSMRRSVYRSVREAVALMNGGYKRLLRLD